MKGSSSADSGRRLWVAQQVSRGVKLQLDTLLILFWQRQQQENKDSGGFLTHRQLIMKTHKYIFTDFIFYALPFFFAPHSPPPALHLDSGSRPGSSCQAFLGPPSPLGSKGEEEEEDEGGNRGLLFLSLALFSSNWPIDSWLMAISSAQQRAALA